MSQLLIRLSPCRLQKCSARSGFSSGWQTKGPPFRRPRSGTTLQTTELSITVPVNLGCRCAACDRQPGLHRARCCPGQRHLPGEQAKAQSGPAAHTPCCPAGALVPVNLVLPSHCYRLLHRSQRCSGTAAADTWRRSSLPYRHLFVGLFVESVRNRTCDTDPLGAPCPALQLDDGGPLLHSSPPHRYM